MPKDFWYWLIVALWILFGYIGYYRHPDRRTWYYWGGDLILLLLSILISLTLLKDPFKTLVSNWAEYVRKGSLQISIWCPSCQSAHG